MPIDETDIEDLAQSPKSVRTDEGRVEERSIDEVIKGDQYSGTKTAIGRVPHGMYVSRTKPGGTTT